MRDLAVWRLAAMDRDERALAEAHREMIEAMHEGLLAFGGPSAAGNRRVRAIEVEMAAAQVRREAQAAHALDMGARAQLAETALDDAAARLRAETEKKTLAEIIEGSLRPAPSASRKA